ncbi:MAG: transcription termination factor Rho [Deltaproteobacteria bacterium]|nr:MAG: transcription termination factor Rho [Deltaproteobacteria bacterium]
MAIDLPSLHDASPDELRELAQGLGLTTLPHRRGEIIFHIARAQAALDGVNLGRGVLEVHSEGFGFLRSPDDNFLPGTEDIYVSQSQIRRFKLQTGDTVVGHVRPPKEGERYTALLRVESINGEPPGHDPISFDQLTAIYPDERIPLGKDPVLRAIDKVCPLGLGQRGLFVAPARTGRVDVLRRICEVLTADEELEVTVLLIGERPEEIQEWRQATTAEVIATPFDDPASRHVQVADIVFERARRQVEHGDNVVVLVDSLTRLLRACLAELPPAGREIGGVDVAALHRLRRYLGAARALEEGGSLTVLGLISGDSDSRLCQALLDDLAEVVNWELILSSEVADRGIRPPIDVGRSFTLRSERLLQGDELAAMEQWRRSLTGDAVEDAAALLTWVATGPTAATATG